MIFQEVGSRWSEAAIVHRLEHHIRTPVVSDLHGNHHGPFNEKRHAFRKLLAACVVRVGSNDCLNMLSGDVNGFLDSLVRFTGWDGCISYRRVAVEDSFEIEIIVYLAQDEFLLW